MDEKQRAAYDMNCHAGDLLAMTENVDERMDSDEALEAHRVAMHAMVDQLIEAGLRLRAETEIAERREWVR